LASGGWDPTDPLWLWEVETGRSFHPTLKSRDVNSVAFDQQGKTLALGLLDGSIVLWDVIEGKQIDRLRTTHKNYVWSVAFSGDGKTLASGSCAEKDTTDSCSQGVIHLWDVAKREQLREPLLGHTSWVRSVTFSSDGTKLASGSDDGTIRLWGVATYQPIG